MRNLLKKKSSNKQNLSSHKQNLVSSKQSLFSHRQNLVSNKQNLSSHKQNLISSKQNLSIHRQNLVSSKQNLSIHRQNLVSNKQNLLINKPKARIHLYYGDGEGKSTNAFGLAIRAIGHGQKVIIIQFLKGKKDIGEYLIKEKLGRLYEIHQFGRKEFIDLMHPTKKDVQLAREGLAFAKTILSKKPQLIVLDELALAAAYGLISVKEVVAFLKKVPKQITVIITGRKAPRELIKISDLITEMKCIKHPYQQGEYAKAGIEY